MNERPSDAGNPDERTPHDDLVCWLREWRIDAALREEVPVAETETVSVPVGGDAAPREALPLQPGPAVGQIRLLHPRHLPRSAGPLYVALIALKDAAMFTAAPFSRFSVPAFESELRTEREVPCLRVLSVGFARPLLAELFSDSWLVDRMSAEELQDALAVFRHAFRGTDDLPRRLMERVGPPLVHPDDPRHTYSEEQAELMDALWAGGKNGASSLVYELPPEGNELPLAAEPRPPYGAPPADGA